MLRAGRSLAFNGRGDCLEKDTGNFRVAILYCRLELGFDGKMADQSRQDTTKESSFRLVRIVLQLAFVASVPVQDIALQFEPVTRFWRYL